jgi:hypothetical protein
MNYTKPAVTLINTAIAVIQSQQPKVGTVSDGQGLNKFITARAYEADE